MVFAAYVVASRQYKIIFLGTQVPKCDFPGHKRQETARLPELINAGAELFDKKATASIGMMKDPHGFRNTEHRT